MSGGLCEAFFSGKTSVPLKGVTQAWGGRGRAALGGGCVGAGGGGWGVGGVGWVGGGGGVAGVGGGGVCGGFPPLSTDFVIYFWNNGDFPSGRVFLIQDFLGGLANGVPQFVPSLEFFLFVLKRGWNNGGGGFGDRGTQLGFSHSPLFGHYTLPRGYIFWG